ncbi:MAG: GntR family transcriptional regulator [Fidelibacterota bacterium]|nr:MAG: GntR family transcriptional regulator [Candidatus Neomarinimicrobiota bacterium]
MSINFDHKTPIYLQVAAMIRDAVASGDLAEGEAIPSVRDISSENSLNPQTVLNATRILIEEAVLEKRRGIGIFVREGARQALLKAELEKFKSEDVPNLTKRARLLGLTQKATLDLVREKFKE